MADMGHLSGSSLDAAPAERADVFALMFLGRTTSSLSRRGFDDGRRRGEGKEELLMRGKAQRIMR